MQGLAPSSRWYVAGLLAAASALSYFDRQSFPVIVGEISKTFAISDLQYSRLQFLFLLAYGLMYAGGGRLIDLVGTRRGYLLCMVWWSLATALHGVVHSVAGLGVARVLLGVGEGGGFPASAKAVSESFPAEERSLAFGIFNAGSTLGAIIAPPVIAVIAINFGWRMVFVIAGGFGLVWALIWSRSYSSRHSDDKTNDTPWRDLFRQRNTWALLIAKFLSDAAWYFFLFWLPKYLTDVRHLDIRSIGYFAWIPYSFGAVGSLGGGWLSAAFIRRGMSLNLSRRITLGMAAALMPPSLFIAASPLWLAIVFFSAAMGGHQCFSTIMQTLTADLYRTNEVASVAGLVGAAGSFGGMLFNLLAGVLLGSTHNYGVVLLLAGLLHPAAFLSLVTLIRRIGPPAAQFIQKPQEVLL